MRARWDGRSEALEFEIGPAGSGQMATYRRSH
jgi:hypothetical protein